jgi:hypothetical protein
MTLQKNEVPKIGISNLSTLISFVLSIVAVIREGNGRRDNVFNRIVSALGLISKVREIAQKIQLSKAELLDLDEEEQKALSYLVAVEAGVIPEKAQEIAEHALGLVSNIFNLIEAIQNARKTA